MKFKPTFGLHLSRGVQQENLRTWFSRVVDVAGGSWSGAAVSQPYTCAPRLGPALGAKLTQGCKRAATRADGTPTSAGAVMVPKLNFSLEVYKS